MSEKFSQLERKTNTKHPKQTNTYGCFVPSLVVIGPVVLENKEKNMESLYKDGQTEKLTDDERQTIRKAYMSF